MFILETGGEEGLFGYDFSQGLHQLERDRRSPTKRDTLVVAWRENGVLASSSARWRRVKPRNCRARRIVDKVQKLGMSALIDEERRFMKYVVAIVTAIEIKTLTTDYTDNTDKKQKDKISFFFICVIRVIRG